MSEVDWRNECEDKKSRAQHILKNEKFTDCTFLVGKECDKLVTIPGHKLIMAMESPVFERMFYGSFDDGKSNEIRIPDIKPNIFHMMMDYIYLEELELKTVGDAMELYSAAKKYMLKDLMRRCVGYLEVPRFAKERWKVYEFAVFFEENDLMTKSAHLMALNTKQVLEDPGFADAKLTTLIALLEKDRLAIDSELALFQRLNKYALANGYFDTKSHVENNEIESEIGKKMRLREALKEIRFLCFTLEQFKIVAKSGLLTDAEVLSILWNLIYPAEMDQPMPEGFSNSRTQRCYNSKF